MENEIRYILNEDIYAQIPKGIKSVTFQRLFTILRKSLHVKYTRKIHIDSILKKCKGKFFKAINDCIRKCLKIYIKKVPQCYITNISIEYNKLFFEFNINDLYNYFNLMPFPLETILNNYCIKGKEAYVKYIFMSKINTLYSFYIQSKRYKKEIELMKKQKDIKVVLLYQFVSVNFINYYYYSKPHTHFKKYQNFELNNYENNFIINNKIINNNISNINDIKNKNENNNANCNLKEKDSSKIQETKKKQFYKIVFFNGKNSIN